MENTAAGKFATKKRPKNYPARKLHRRPIQSAINIQTGTSAQADRWVFLSFRPATQIRNLVERIQMPTVRSGQPMTHLILSAAGPPPKEKKLPIPSLWA